MGVYIKGMGMPKSCSRCFCMASCKLWKNITAPEFYRHRNCPLVPDIDHAPYSGFDGEDAFYSAADAAQIIRLAPTVIPAEMVQQKKDEQAGVGENLSLFADEEENT